MIGQTALYPVIGCFLAAASLMNLRDRTNDRRHSTAAFWGLLALVFLVGDRLPKAAVGGIVVVIALLAGVKGVKGGASKGAALEARAASAFRLGGRLLWPTLLIPILTVLLTLVFKFLTFHSRLLVDPTQATLVALALGCILALVAALVITRDRPAVSLQEGRRLLDAIGWAALLPLLLATLGAVFTSAGVGNAVAFVIQKGLPMDIRLVALVAYALGMALLTMVMGNAFAAFPVMMGGIGIPVLMKLHGANPAALASMGMLCGYCGTLLTPMAANFNLVPAALLELDDTHAVIKAQAPTAVLLWVANVILMALLVFP